PLASVVSYLADFCGTNVPLPSTGDADRGASHHCNTGTSDSDRAKLQTARRLDNLLEHADLAGRPIALKGAWWQSLRIPAIIWTREGTPHAFAPTGRVGGYVFDPVSGTRRKIDAGIASNYKTMAHSVQATLPVDRVGFWDLVKLGFQGSRRDIGFLALFGAAGALVGLLTPVVTAILVNTAIPESDLRTVLELSLVLVGVAVAVTVFRFLEATAVLRLETLFEAKVQPAIWHRLLRLPADFFRDFESGNLAQRLMGISQIRTLLSQGVASAVLGGVFAVLNFAVMLYFGGSLTLVAVVLSLLTVLVALVVNVLKVRRLRQSVAALDNLAGLSLQSLVMIEKLRVASAENRFLARLLGLLAKARRHDYRARMADNALQTYNAAIPLVSTGLFIAVVGLVLETPPLTGDFVAFTAAYGTYVAGLTGLLASVSAAMAGVVLFERMQPILEATPEHADKTGDVPALSGDIEFSGVTYRYRPDAPAALHNVSFKVRSGQFAAIVGPSGSGKSTLVRLLLGFDSPEEGNILFDGRELAHLSKGAVRSQCGVVLQNNRLLGGSIHECICGSKPLTRDETWAAAEKAGLADTIRNMPMGLDTIVNSERSISGGERQRLMLARALAGDPAVLVLDEATSALDNATQAGVAQTLAGLEVTRIVVAHRLSTILDADVVFVLEDGQVSEAGTVDELLSAGGTFAKMAERQQL
ncbi:MAG: ATP-binding cassette domain-containing protein, partial [Pseudomonadota bacterium]